MRNLYIRRLIALFCGTSLLLVSIYVSSAGNHRSVNSRSRGNIILNELSGLSESQPSDTIKTDNLPLKYNPENGLKIIIYAKHRTGSTFTGEIFNAHKDIYFIFEPLNFLYLEQVIDYGLDVVNDTLNCRLTQLGQLTRHSRRQWLRDHVFCQLENQTAGCPRVSLALAESFCHRHRHVATKLITLRQIETLEPLMADGVNVIQLVRDPRGVLSSRKPYIPELKWTTVAYDTSDIYCSSVLKDLAYIRGRYRIRPGHVNRSYFLLRYEDLASKIDQTIQEIYNFLGITPDAALGSWASRQSSDSVNMSSGWREKLSFQEVILVQGACQAMMEVMGYRKLSSQQELSNPSFHTLLSYDKTGLLQIWGSKLRLLLQNQFYQLIKVEKMDDSL